MLPGLGAAIAGAAAAAAGGFSWSMNGPDSLTNNTGGWAGFTLRQAIPSSQVPALGNYVRFTLKAGSVGLALTKVYVGIQGTGSFDFASTPVRALFSGSTGFSIAANATITCDPVALVTGSGQGLVIAMYCPASPDSFSREQFVPAGILEGFKGADDATTLIASGYTTAGGTNRFYVSLETSP